jgi:hypothetical protein
MSFTTKHVIRFSLLLVVLLLTIFVYTLNQTQILKKKQMVETFLEQIKKDDSNEHNEATEEPASYTEQDFNIYANIIGIYKHATGKPPGKADLFSCYKRIKANELTYAQITDELHRDRSFDCGKQTQTFSDREVNTTDTDTDTDTDTADINNTTQQNHHGKTGVSDPDLLLLDETTRNKTKDEEATQISDSTARVQYIINRPTIYNIGTHSMKTLTQTANKAQAQARKTLKEIVKPTTQQTSIKDEVSVTKIPEMDISSVDNICYNSEYFTRLADFAEKRNFDKLQFGCETNKNMKQASKDLTKKSKQTKKTSNKIDGWSLNPLGTSIREAENTSIGSILPKFKFEEEANSVF